MFVGVQKIVIGWERDLVGVTVHEMFHSLGRCHEHQRVDRRMYVYVDENNIIPSELHFYSLSNIEVYHRVYRVCYTCM